MTLAGRRVKIEMKWNGWGISYAYVALGGQYEEALVNYRVQNGRFDQGISQLTDDDSDKVGLVLGPSKTPAVFSKNGKLNSPEPWLLRIESLE